MVLKVFSNPNDSTVLWFCALLLGQLSCAAPAQEGFDLCRMWWGNLSTCLGMTGTRGVVGPQLREKSFFPWSPSEVLLPTLPWALTRLDQWPCSPRTRADGYWKYSFWPHMANSSATSVLSLFSALYLPFRLHLYMWPCADNSIQPSSFSIFMDLWTRDRAWQTGF